MDASEGQRLLHKRSADDLDNENNDEHWLWSRVDRIKRSIDTVFGNDNERTKSKSRVKRGWFDWAEPVESTPDDGVTTTTLKNPFESLFDFGNANKDEKSTTKAPEVEHPAANLNHAQADESRNEDEDEDSTPEDDDNEIYDGSGYSKVEVTRTVYETKLERFCKFMP